jgi:AcrR family transcriptional regulator
MASQMESAFASHPLLKITSAAQLEIRRRILTAARQRFARFSHEDTTLTDIARGAGLPPDEVRLHFADTRAVLLALRRTLDSSRSAARGPRINPVKAREGARLARQSGFGY